MLERQDLKVVLPCVFPNTDPIWMMLHTCERFHIEPKLFGLNTIYQGWLSLKLDLLRQVTQECMNEGYTHVLYSDARDAWFCSGLQEVVEKYNAMGAPPILLSAQRHPFCGGYADWYAKVKWDTSLFFPYLGTPGQLCRVEALIDALTWMREQDGYPDDDPAPWCHYMSEFPVKLDHECAIFMNVGDMDAGEWEIRDGRAYNKLTGEQPCIIHFNGGGSDALKGKWESLEKPWREFGYTINPPWEEA